MNLKVRPFSCIDTLQSIYRRCESEKGLKKPYRFCFYGYTDVMLNREEWLKVVPQEKYARLTNRANWANLIKIHGRTDVEMVPTLSSIQEVVFDGNIVIDVFDFQKYEGGERLVDLNLRVPAELERTYDAVFDNGTSEHVFNYAQVLINSHLIVKERGFIRHDVPLNWPNHGFYSLNPTLFHDFYEDNGATTVECIGHFLNRAVQPPQHVVVEGLPRYDRFCFNQTEINVVYTVQKRRHLSEFVFPVQRKYRDPKAWV